MCVGIKVYICTHIFRNSCVYACGIYVRVCAYTCTYTYTIYLRVCMHTCGLCVYVCVCVCVYIYIYVSVFVCAYTCTHRYTYLAYKALTSTYIMCMPYGICVRVHTHIQIYRNLYVYTYDIYVRVCAYTCTHTYMIYLNVCVYICGLCVCAYTCTHRYAHITYKALTSTYSMCMSYGICLRVHTHIHIY